MPKHDEQVTVSVVMPVYNGARWLAAALESVLAQTLSNIEVLIVDDASLDDTARIAGQFAARDARVHVLRQPRNAGQSAARNVAIERARGVWIAPVDADDEIHPDRLRLLAKAGERGHADFIADGILFQGASGSGTPTELMTWGRRDDDLEVLSAEALIRSGMQGGYRSLGYLKPLMRRQFLNERNLRYLEDLRFAEDINLYARALFSGAQFLLYPESLYVYRQTPVSASRTEISRIAPHALTSSQCLRAILPQAGSARLSIAFDEYEQRWSLLHWFEQIRRALAGRHFAQVIALLLRRPASPGRIVRFAYNRARLKRRDAGLPQPIHSDTPPDRTRG